MAVWQRPARVGLATFAVAFGVAVVVGIRDRVPPAVAVGVERADPEAVTQSRGARIIQQDASDENLRVSADRQMTYSDGRARFLDDVDLFVPALEERVEFRLRGDEAMVDEEAGTVHVVGNVRFETGDGLLGTTTEASYDDNHGIVEMPGVSRFERDWMQARGGTARYNRRGDLLYLEPDAHVALAAEGREETRIGSREAVVAQREGYMRFDGDVVVDTGTQVMQASEVRTAFEPDVDRLDAIELIGDARITGSEPTPGELREMAAPEINVTYGEELPERVELANGSRIELFGDGGGGADISSRSMEIGLSVEGTGFEAIRAQDGVVVELPPADGVRQRIESKSLHIGATLPDVMSAVTEGAGPIAAWPDEAPDEATALRARFDDGIIYRETRHTAEAAESYERVIRAGRLEASLDNDLSGLRDARFIGRVEFEARDVVGRADQATYDVGEGSFTLITLGSGGQTPRVNDVRGSLESDTIVVRFDGPDLDATGEVAGVLTSTPSTGEVAEGDPDARDVKRPQLLAEGPPIYVTASTFAYESALSRATYTGDARLWQDQTEFRGETLILDESTGNVTAEEDVRTQSTMLQNDDTTGEPVEVSTVGRSARFVYDDATRTASYTTDATLEGERVDRSTTFDLAAGAIDVILHEDARSLDRIVALEDVSLSLDNRRVEGSTLTYYDVDGRYVVAGAPARIVEEVDGGCRETTGRTITFFVTAEALSIDGASEVRTESTNGDCSS